MRKKVLMEKYLDLVERHDILDYNYLQMRRDYHASEEAFQLANKEANEYQGAMSAADEQLLKATNLLDMPPAGCDTAQELADVILGFRNEVQSLIKLTVDIAKDRDAALKDAKWWNEQANSNWEKLSKLQLDSRCQTHRAVQLARHVSYKNDKDELCTVPKDSILILSSIEDNHWFCYFKTDLIPILFTEANYWFKEKRS